MKEENEDSSSCDDEAIIKTIEAVAETELWRESLFAEKSTKQTQDTKEHCVDKHDEVEVSEGFKNFMAKKLAEHLDRNIEIMKEVTCSNKIRKRKHVDHPEPEDGIKLLRASGTIVKVVDDPTTSNVYTCRPSHRRILPDQNVKADSVKLKEAAVDPQYLFDGADTDFWISRRKSTVYEYKKLPDGTLVEK